MIDVLHQWYQRYFTDYQAVVLSVLLALALVVLVFMGDMLAPILTSIVVAYVLDWGVTHLERLRLSRRLSVGIVFTIFIGLSLLSVLTLFPLMWQQGLRLVNELPTMIGSWQAS